MENAIGFKKIYYWLLILSLGIISGTGQASSGENTTRKQHRDLLISNPALLKFLSVINENINIKINRSLAEQNNSGENMHSLARSAYVTQEALTLLQEIINDVNSGKMLLSPEIQHYFFSICRLFEGFDGKNMLPHHIRSLRYTLRKFNHHRLNRLLSPEERLMYKRITKLNHILAYELLNEEYFNIGFFDRAFDYAFYRPWEIICNRPFTAGVIGVCAVSALGLGYYYFYSSSTESVADRLNQYAAVNIRGVQQQGDLCGVYSMLNAIIVSSAQNEDEAREMMRLANGNQNIANILIEQAIQNRRLNGSRRNNASMLRHDEVQLLANDQGLINRIRRELGIVNPAQFNAIPVIQNPALLHIGNNELTAEFCAGVNALREQGIAQTIIAYCGTNAVNAEGHWLVLKIMQDHASFGGIRAWVIESTTRNALRDPSITVLLDVYNQSNDIPLPMHLNAFATMQTAHSVLNPDVHGEPADIARRSFSYLCNGISALLRTNNNFFTDGAHEHQAAYCQNMFDHVRAHWVAFGIENILIPIPHQDAERMLNLNECVTFENFIQWLQN